MATQKGRGGPKTTPDGSAVASGINNNSDKERSGRPPLALVPPAPDCDPRIIEDLGRSGLTPTDLRVELRPKGRGLFRTVDAYRIQYTGPDGQPTGFYRDRALEDWIPSNDDKPRRYLQPKGYAPGLYFPICSERPWSEVNSDPSAPILITEGEKKAACACKHGFPTVGLGGVECWRTKIRPDGTAGRTSRPIPDLDLIDWKGRTALIVFDADRKLATQTNVRRAAEALALELIDRGAAVHISNLPLCDGQKMGLDDFLLARGAEVSAPIQI
jgi:hypothetical protein